jgi:hypothetical protein
MKKTSFNFRSNLIPATNKTGKLLSLIKSVDQLLQRLFESGAPQIGGHNFALGID